MSKKIVFILFCALILIASIDVPTNASEITDLENSVSKLKDSLSPQVRDDLEKIGATSYELSALDDIEFSDILDLISNKFSTEAVSPLSSGALVIAIVILSAILEGYKDSLKRTSMQETISVVSTLCVTTTLVIPVIKLINSSIATIKDASNFMLLYIPIMLMVLAFSGKTVTGTSYYSFMVMVCQGVAQISTKFISPLLNVYLSFCVSSALCDRINMKSFCELFSKVIKWLISFLMTIFSAMLTIRGMITTAYDSVTARAVRFTMSSFIPIVGAALAESYKTIQGSINLIRTGAGVFVILAILVVFLPTIIRCVVWLFTINLCKSVSQMIGVNSVSVLLSTISSVVSTVFAITACIMALFIISTALIITISGGA